MSLRNLKDQKRKQHKNTDDIDNAIHKPGLTVRYQSEYNRECYLKYP